MDGWMDGRVGWMDEWESYGRGIARCHVTIGRERDGKVKKPIT